MQNPKIETSRQEGTLDAIEEAEKASKGEETVPKSTRFQWLNWSSLFCAVLQSVCSAFLAVSGIRLFIGAAAFASAIGVIKVVDKLHGNKIRTPMLLVALFGSFINLAALWQVRRLRRRPSAAWRQAPVAAKKKDSERLQLVLSLVTLLLVVAELIAHWKVKG